MQALAKYVFQTGNVLCAGDHVSWHCPLDNSESRIEHMLMTEDPQLGSTTTAFGSVTFVQIVGVCLEELQAAQQWNGTGLIDLIKSVPSAGGPWLLTDMRRGETIFELDPELKEAVDDGIATQGSNLSGVSARCSYSRIEEERQTSDEEEERVEKNKSQLAEEKSQLNGPTGECSRVDSRTSRHSSMSVSHDRHSRMSMSSINAAQEEMTGNAPPAVPMELTETKFIDSLHLTFNYEAGNLLPLALRWETNPGFSFRTFNIRPCVFILNRGRLKHDRHFTFKNIQGDLAITFVTPSVYGSVVTREQRYATHGPWLQVLIASDEIDKILGDLDEVSELEKVRRHLVNLQSLRLASLAG